MTQAAPHILVIRSGAIGDTIVMSVVYQALRQHFSRAYIEAVGVTERVQLINTPGLIDTITSLESPGIVTLFTEDNLMPRFASSLRHFDYILVYSFNRDISVRLRTLHPEQQIYQFDPFPSDETARHVTTYLLETLHALDITGHHPIPRVAIAEEYQPFSASLSCPIAIHPGSGSQKKNWDADNFAELCRRLADSYSAQVLLISGPAEHETIQVVCSKLSGIALHMFTDHPLPEIAAELQHCTLYIGNDSGISHLAAAVGIPTIAIFGPSNPHIWRPAGKQVIVMHDEIRKDCNAISVEQVMTEAARFL